MCDVDRRSNEGSASLEVRIKAKEEVLAEAFRAADIKKLAASDLPLPKTYEPPSLISVLNRLLAPTAPPTPVTATPVPVTPVPQAPAPVTPPVPRAPPSTPVLRALAPAPVPVPPTPVPLAPAPEPVQKVSVPDQRSEVIQTADEQRNIQPADLR